MVLVIDNYDSFTYNLVQYLGELGVEVRVFRNDRITTHGIRRLGPDHVVISPGPCTPGQAGVSVDVVRDLGAEMPILGVCLGHQSIGQAFGGNVVHAREVMHGKTSLIHHDGAGVFRGLENPLEATRYHSLIVERKSLPDCLYETAWTADETARRDEIMGIRHRELPIEGVQFHPESILTPLGKSLLENFLAESAGG
jgi:anthranilate synthase component 2